MASTADLNTWQGLGEDISTLKGPFQDEKEEMEGCIS